MVLKIIIKKEMSFISLPSVYLCYVRSYYLKAFLAPLVAIKNHTRLWLLQPK